MNRILIRTRYVAAVLVAGLIMASCTSFRPVPLADLQNTVKAGDHVWVVTRDGERTRLDVQDITTTAIVGTTRQIELQDIKELERRDVSPARTAGFGLIILGAAATVYLVLLGMYGPK